MFAGTHSYEVLGCVKLPADALGVVTPLEGDVFDSDCCELAKCHMIASINIICLYACFVCSLAQTITQKIYNLMCTKFCTYIYAMTS